jgi:hypothetical protein
MSENPKCSGRIGVACADRSLWRIEQGCPGLSQSEACLGWGCYAYLLDRAARALRRPAIRRASERITAAIRIGSAFASRSSTAESPLGRCPNWP